MMWLYEHSVYLAYGVLVLGLLFTITDIILSKDKA